MAPSITFPFHPWGKSGEKVNMSALAGSVSGRPGLLAANLSRRTPLLAIPAAEVGKLFHIAECGHENAIIRNRQWGMGSWSVAP